MSTIAGKTALITGGASGIGLGLAKELLAEGAARVVLWDINADSLARQGTALKAAGHAVTTDAVDVTDNAAMAEAVVRLGQAAIAVDILVNNAGIVVGKRFAAHSESEIARTMAINAEAPMQLTRLILPGMMKRGSGHVVNIASAAGLVSNPKMSVYVGSKFALTGWSDSLRLEMRRGKTGVKVLTVAPFYINTGMFSGVQSPFIPILEPDDAVRRIVRSIRRDRIHARMPWIVGWVPLLKGVLPTRVFDWVAGDLFGMHRSMDHFTGRKED
ncbi:MAG: all-trans-retinol dehydrogenase (NAD+) [Rhodothermales bacterium]|jgi:all-trans-retinol dehydrogenase (NAD+)